MPLKWANKADWGPWHYGTLFDVRFGTRYTTNNQDSKGIVAVEIRDAYGMGKVVARCGKWQNIGNFSPVWVNFRGKNVSIEDVLHWKG